MATDVQQYRRAMREIEQADRELAYDLRKAQGATKRAIAKVAAQMRRQDAQAGRRLKIAWRRPPGRRLRFTLGRMPWRVGGGKGGGARVARAAAARGGQTGRGDTFHFRLNQRSEKKVCRSHQGYIERDSACVESFGTIADTFEERCRLWDALADRTDKKTGCITVTGAASTKLKSAVAAKVLGWAEEKRMSVGQEKQLNRGAEHKWDNGKAVRIKTFDSEDHARMLQWVREVAKEEEDGAESGEEEAQRKRRLPAGVKHHAPCQGVVRDEPGGARDPLPRGHPPARGRQRPAELARTR